MPISSQPGTVWTRVENFFIDNYRDIGSIMSTKVNTPPCTSTSNRWRIRDRLE